jgi:hypothetical protein
VNLMFGSPSITTHHLTRGIGGVTAVDILRSATGHDLALRIVHGTGQTLLTFGS